ncbi:hypothetical protein OS493_028677 [Desmophyllum pertusum]|uniref:Uncharacterized protein n=1 Tax=Desmophyllum pertusum TaxID=174260 RepID=A0A9W9YKI3_9CNID|nr:hypothetical protein OS493_028677 [Desmophyllum pertusum]
MAGDASYEQKKDSEVPQSSKELIKEFCSYTTTHGLGRLVETKILFCRLTWAAFILGAFAMFIYQTHGLFIMYLSRPVSTVVKVKHKSQITFPAVTVCNQNTIKYSKIPDHYFDEIIAEIRQRLEDEKNEDQKDDVTTPTPEVPTNAATDYMTEVPTNAATDSMTENNDTDDYDPEEDLRIDYLFEDLLLSYLAIENYTTLHKMGHEYKDFVFDCNFRGIDCRYSVR